MKLDRSKGPAFTPLFVASILVTLGGVHPLFSQGTAFTYQGRLTDNGSLPNANYDMKFSLYDSPGGPNQIGGTILQSSIPVNGGLFTTTPALDFGASIFTGPPRWLKIEISPAGANTFTPLSARQPLTAAPYAVRAGDAGTLVGQSPAAFAPASGSSAYVARAGDTMTGTLNLPPNGLAVGANQLVASGGNIGIGTATPSALLDLFDGSFHTKLFGDFISFTRNNGPAYIWAENPGGRIDFVTGGRATSDATANLVLNTDQSSYFNGNVGIGTTTPDAGLHVINPTGFNLPGIHIEQPAVFDFAQIRLNVTGSPYWAMTVGSGSTPSLNFGFNNTQMMNLGSDGTLQVKVLQINGADVAEPFQVSAKDVPKGSVMIIDEENPGRLKLSDRAYDKRVAGILSGAHGVNSGICLKQQGFNDGGQNVALSGRVYAFGDASFGAIRPGDLLTTSDTPGHCMKVTDHARASGAIIGKAMSSLSEGKGMVLVLVSLQ